MQILPLIPSVPSYNFTTTISDDPAPSAVYRFDFLWNGFEGYWYMKISEADGTLIAGGIKLVLGVYLARMTKHSLFTNGIFFLYDTSGDHKDAGIDDLGTRVRLARLTTAEMSLLNGTD